MGVAHLTLQSIWTWALVILRQWTSNWKYSQILFQNVNLGAVTKGAPKHKTLFKHSRLKGQLLSQSLSNPLHLGSYQYHCIASAYLPQSICLATTGPSDVWSTSSYLQSTVRVVLDVIGSRELCLCCFFGSLNTKHLCKKRRTKFEVNHNGCKPVSMCLLQAMPGIEFWAKICNCRVYWQPCALAQPSLRFANFGRFADSTLWS